MANELVSVICLCYNQERFVKEAILSVLNQTYKPVELIIVDDGSADASRAIIESTINTTTARFIPLEKNVGMCKAFNRGLAFAKGRFIIDLAADDVLLPERITLGVDAFYHAGIDTGVQFSDAELMDEAGRFLGFHSERFPHDSTPQGDVYRDLITKYFISSPTMMMRREVLDEMGGYDETLAYEDFDLWIRSSRKWRYTYIPAPLVRRRIVQGSMGRTQHSRASRQLESTFRVCQKIMDLNRTADESMALNQRIRYEIRRMVRFGRWDLAWQYLLLHLKNRSNRSIDHKVNQ